MFSTVLARYLVHLLVKVNSQPGDSEVIFSVFESSCHTCYYQSNHSTVEAILLSALPKEQGHNKRICRLILNYPFMLNVKLNEYNDTDLRGLSKPLLKMSLLKYLFFYPTLVQDDLLDR